MFTFRWVIRISLAAYQIELNGNIKTCRNPLFLLINLPLFEVSATQNTIQADRQRTMRRRFQKCFRNGRKGSSNSKIITAKSATEILRWLFSQVEVIQARRFFFFCENFEIWTVVYHLSCWDCCGGWSLKSKKINLFLQFLIRVLGENRIRSFVFVLPN